MASIDLTADDTVVEDETTASASPAALTAPAASSLAVSAPLTGGVVGDFSSKDIKVPRLNVVQKMSDDLIELGHSPGDVAYNREVKYIPFGKSGLVTVLGLVRQYQQKIPYGTKDVIPDIVDTEEEVYAKGGTLAYDGVNVYQPIAHITCLVEATDAVTEDHEAYFPFEHGDKLYALAKWTVASTAYKDVAVPLISAAKLYLRDGLHKVKWKLSVRKKTNGQNSWFAPSLVQAGKNSPEFIEFAAGFLG